jgi:hypothetical protein
LPEHIRRRPRQLSPIVRAYGLVGAVSGGTVKQQDDLTHLMELDQILALATKLLRAKDVAVARGKGATAARDIQPVKLGESQLGLEKRVGSLLETTIGASHDEHSRSDGRPCSEHRRSHEQNLVA